jgi:vancomycin resistance protein VanW
MRAWKDRGAGLRFASARTDSREFPFEWSRYERPFIDYPGQEQLGAAKRANQARLSSFLHGVVIEPGEVFSVWKLSGAPDEKHGYARAAAVRNGLLTTEPGGAICLLSTVLYNAALLAGLAIVERHCHSVDSYGERRYFELGRDAAIEYGYLDLRFRNDQGAPLQLRVDVTRDRVEAAVFGSEEKNFVISLDIGPAESLVPLPGDRGRYWVRSMRRRESTAGEVIEDLGWSVYRVPLDGFAIQPPAQA